MIVRRLTKVVLVVLALWAFWAGLLFIFTTLASLARADVHFHGLERIVVNDGEVRDSLKTGEGTDGLLVVTAGDDSKIESLFFTARFAEVYSALSEDIVDVVVRHEDGMTYTVKSEVSGEEYQLQLLGGPGSVLLLLHHPMGGIILLEYKQLTML